LIRTLRFVSLKTGERLRVAALGAPAGRYAAAIRRFLDHKGQPWLAHVDLANQDRVGRLRTTYYVGLLGRAIVGNVMIVDDGRVGILGHVFTDPPHRRKGICQHLMAAAVEGFRAAGGRALSLGTGYRSPPYWRYHSFGFRGVERRLAASRSQFRTRRNCIRPPGGRRQRPHARRDPARRPVPLLRSRRLAASRSQFRTRRNCVRPPGGRPRLAPQTPAPEHWGARGGRNVETRNPNVEAMPKSEYRMGRKRGRRQFPFRDSGIRISAFLRHSDFDFRISGFISLPPSWLPDLPDPAGEAGGQNPEAGGRAPRPSGLVPPASGLVPPAALLRRDPRWPGAIHTLDLFVHPNFQGTEPRLLSSLKLPKAAKIQAYLDRPSASRARALADFGFRREATLRRQIARRDPPVDALVYSLFT